MVSTQPPTPTMIRQNAANFLNGNDEATLQDRLPSLRPTSAAEVSSR